jgi:preprotein translocase subunit SecA
MTTLEVVLSFLIGLAANGTTSAVVEQRQCSLDEVLADQDLLRKALPFGRSLRDEMRTACIELAQNRARLHISQQEEPLWRLMADERFQDDLTEWLKAGAIKEGDAVRERLIQSMEQALANAGRASSEQIEFLKTGYFEALERTVFSNPVLAHWRHQLSLDYLRDQVAELRRQAEEAAGI